MSASPDLSVTDQRCLTCQHFDADHPNPEAEECALEMRYGPEAALVGACRHPEHPTTINTKFDCEDWQANASPLRRANDA